MPILKSQLKYVITFNVLFHFFFQAGCIHFASNTTDLRILVLLFNPDKKSLLGFIPNNQSGFLDRLKKVILSQKKTNGARHEQVSKN